MSEIDDILDIEGAILRLEEDIERLQKENKELLDSLYYKEIQK